MSEYIISDEQIMSERRQAYDAGKRNRKIWTARVYHGEEIVRCRDCKYHVENDTLFSFYNGTCDWWAESPKVDPEGFCSWGVRRDA